MSCDLPSATSSAKNKHLRRIVQINSTPAANFRETRRQGKPKRQFKELAINIPILCIAWKHFFG